MDPGTSAGVAGGASRTLSHDPRDDSALSRAASIASEDRLRRREFGPGTWRRIILFWTRILVSEHAWLDAGGDRQNTLRSHRDRSPPWTRSWYALCLYFSRALERSIDVECLAGA